jgi:hypothetical protein
VAVGTTVGKMYVSCIPSNAAPRTSDTALVSEVLRTRVWKSQVRRAKPRRNRMQRVQEIGNGNSVGPHRFRPPSQMNAGSCQLVELEASLRVIVHQPQVIQIPEGYHNSATLGLACLNSWWRPAGEHQTVTAYCAEEVALETEVLSFGQKGSHNSSR